MPEVVKLYNNKKRILMLKIDELARKIKNHVNIHIVPEMWMLEEMDKLLGTLRWIQEEMEKEARKGLECGYSEQVLNRFK